MNQVTGLNKPITPAAAQGQSRADEIQALAKANTKPAPPPAPNLGDMVADQFKQSGQKITSSVTEGADKMGQDIAQGKAAQETGDIKGVVQHGAEFVGHTLETGLGTAAGAVQGIFAPVTAVIQKALQLDPLAANKNPNDKGSVTGQEVDPHQETAISAWAKAHPEAAKNLMDAFSVGTAATGGEAAIAGKTAAGMTAEEGVNAVKNAGVDAYKGISDLLESPNPIEHATPAVQKGGLLENLRTRMATKGNSVLGALSEEGKPNVLPQTQTSAQRLAEQATPGGVGAAIKPKPVDTYNARIASHEAHMSDIKKPAALSLDGADIGKGFDQVVKTRQAVGKQMAAALEKTASKPVDLKAPLGEFQKELLDNGAHYDSVNRDVVGGPNSKFATPDKQILQKYAQELQDLGSNPTMKALDAFVSRIPKEIEGLKATNKIEFKTNAERIVNNSLDSIRDSLAKSGTPAYRKARTTYSSLSNFLGEGAKFLGAKTQGGTYARDASLAKSAVQSLLSGGKKDWLIKLEGLTGKPYLDNVVMSLQAMKDLGDFKGLSLLEGVKDIQDLIKGVVPTPSGTTAKIIGFLGKKGAQALAGTDVERTRAFLNSLK